MTINDLEPCRYFNVGMVVWVLLWTKKHKDQAMWIPFRVVEAHGHSAYVENKKDKIEQWIDLRHHDVMVRKEVKNDKQRQEA